MPHRGRMEEITGIVVPEAPPGDVDADTAVAVAEAPVTEATADASAPTAAPEPGHPGFEAWLAADAERINAEVAAAESGEPAEAVADPTATAADTKPAAAPASPATTETPKPAATAQAEVDEAAALAALQARGYKVEAPAPPPDPNADLVGRLSPYVGTAEEYAQTQAAALVQLPSEPASYEPETVAAHEAAVKTRNEAAAKLQTMNLARSVTDVASEWAERRAMGRLGSALESLTQQYAVPADKAARVSRPTAMTDAVAAVVETVTDRLNTEWQTKLDAEVKRLNGEVARAKSDRSAASLQRMGNAPQPSSGPGGRQGGPGELYEIDQRTGLPTEAAIQRMIRGDFANADLSGR